MTMPANGFALSVDLGTSNTVAVLRWPDGRTRPLLVDGAPIMPSGVFLDDTGRLHVGRDAGRLAQLDPSRFEPNPKRRIDEPAVLLGDREVPTVDLFAAILGAVARAAVEAVGHLPPAVLTYPASWGLPRRTVLTTAVQRAGWPPVALVPEPVGAARYFVEVLRRPVPVGWSLAVFDFGGGTLDVAVVRNDGGRFVVAGSGGVADLGGLDVDAAIVDHLGTTIGAAHPQAWRAVVEPQSTADFRTRHLFWEDVRGAKEMLSRSPLAPVTLPGVDEAAQLTRDQLEQVATPLLKRAVAETGSVIRLSGLRPDQLAGLFLVGGSSRLPIVARLLHSELGIAPTVLEQPELPVAEGALVELAGPAPAPTLSSPPAPPVSSVPMSPGPMSSGPMSPGPMSPGPMGRATVPTGQPAHGQVTPGTGMPGQRPPGAPPVPGGLLPPVPARQGIRKRWLAFAAAAVVLLLAVGIGGWYLLREDTADPVEFQALGSGTAVPLVDEAYSTSGTSTWVDGDTGVLAEREDEELVVRSVSLPKGNVQWTQRLAGEDWLPISVTGKYVLARVDQVSSSEKGALYVLDRTKQGAIKQLDLYGSDGALLFDDMIVVRSPTLHRLTGYDLATVTEKWHQDDPVDEYKSQLSTIMVSMRSTAQVDGPADQSGLPARSLPSGDGRVLRIDSAGNLAVFNARDGKQVGATRAISGDTNDHFAALDGKLYVGSTPSGGRYEIKVYDLDKPGEPRTVYTDPEGRSLAYVEACGTKRVCVLDTKGSTEPQLRSINSEASGKVWNKPVPGADRLVAVGDWVLATGGSSGGRSHLFDPDGRSHANQAGPGVRVNGASVLIVASNSGGYPQDTDLYAATTKKDAFSIGPLSQVVVNSCSWSDRYLICARKTDFRIWRLTK